MQSTTHALSSDTDGKNQREGVTVGAFGGGWRGGKVVAGCEVGGSFRTVSKAQSFSKGGGTAQGRSYGQKPAQDGEKLRSHIREGGWGLILDSTRNPTVDPNERTSA